jgi:hypothetical protein
MPLQTARPGSERGGTGDSGMGDQPLLYHNSIRELAAMRRKVNSQHPREDGRSCGISWAHSGLHVRSHQIQQVLKCLRLPLALQVHHLGTQIALVHERNRLELPLCDFLLHGHEG